MAIDNAKVDAIIEILDQFAKSKTTLAMLKNENTQVHDKLILLLDLGRQIAIATEKVCKEMGAIAPSERSEYSAVVMDRIVKLPFPLEMFDKTLFKMVIDWLIKNSLNKVSHNWLVSQFNALFGEGFCNKIGNAINGVVVEKEVLGEAVDK